MKLFKSISILILFLSSSVVSAQETASENVPMADAFYAEGKIYVVIGVLSIVFIGIAIYLFSIERKVKKLEEAIKNKD